MRIQWLAAEVSAAEVELSIQGALPRDVLVAVQNRLEFLVKCESDPDRNEAAIECVKDAIAALEAKPKKKATKKKTSTTKAAPLTPKPKPKAMPLIDEG